MATAQDLFSSRVVVGHEEERLADIAVRIRATEALRVVVVEPAGGRFRGIVRLSEAAQRSFAGNRILADLVSNVTPLAVRADEPAELVCELLERHALSEIVVLGPVGEYEGLICAEDAFRWLLAENRSARARLAGLHALQIRLAGVLEQKVEQRTAELRSSVDAIRSGSIALAHDIRAPLRSIRGFAEILAEGRADSDPARLARGISSASARLELLAENLLADAARALGAQPTPPALVDLNEVWDDALSFHAALIHERGAEIVKTASLHRVAGDYVPLLQIVANLLGNAVKYVPANRLPRIEASSEETETHIVFRLRDNGRGIAPLDRERLFNPFARGSNVGDQLGSGLGLAIAQDAARLLRADLAIEKTDYGGSVFSIRMAKTPTAEASVAEAGDGAAADS